MFEMKNRYGASSIEKTANPEGGLMQYGVASYGETSSDLGDMLRLGKKQEFQVSLSSAGPRTLLIGY